MAKNPLWVLENLGPVVADYARTIPDGRKYGDFESVHYWLESRAFTYDADYYFDWLRKEATERHDFVRYALDTLPRNSVGYHALLDFMRYYR